MGPSVDGNTPCPQAKTLVAANRAKRCPDCQLQLRRDEQRGLFDRINKSPPAPVEIDDDPDLASDVDDPDAEAATDVDELPDPAAPAPARTFDERRCVGKRCLKKFTPTHPAQKLCPTCRGARVDDSGAAPKTTSWWANTTSRDDFQNRAKEQEDRLKGSKEKFAVPNRILGERA